MSRLRMTFKALGKYAKSARGEKLDSRAAVEPSRRTGRCAKPFCCAADLRGAREEMTCSFILVVAQVVNLRSCLDFPKRNLTSCATYYSKVRLRIPNQFH